MAVYPFNPQGASGVNSITNETQVLAPLPNQKYNYLIPLAAPFFMDSMSVSIVATNQSLSNYPLNTKVNLTLGVDYFIGLAFVDASVKCGKSLIGAICFVDPALAGAVSLSYVTVGGNWTVTPAQIATLISTQAINPRMTCWEDAFQVTAIFPTYQFGYSEQQMVGFNDLATQLGAIANTLGTSTTLPSAVSLSAHLSNFNNPHQDTAATYNLGNVPNWAVATVAQAQAGSANNLFVTPAGAAAATVSPTVTPLATTAMPGLVQLNVGANPVTDALDNTKALTTSGLLTMKNSLNANAISSLFLYERQIVYFTPAPIGYPVICLGYRCQNFYDLVAAVSNYFQFSPVQASAKRGCVYLPNDMPTPNLTLTPYHG